MTRDVVQFVETFETTGCFRIHDNAYSFNARCGHVWLQRLAFWFLRRIGCFTVSDFTERRYVVVDPRRAMDEIFKQHRHLLQHLGRGGETLLIGAEDWDEMIFDPAVRSHVMAFDGEYYFAVGDGKKSRRIRVCVVPWMKGVLMLPKGMLG